MAFYTDKDIRRKQAKIRKLKDPREINRLKNEIAKDMENLKRKIES